MILDERRQRDNRRECLCCVTRGKPLEENEETDVFQEDMISRYFRNYHAPAIMSKTGKTIIILLFTGLLSFGFYGALNLPVEDSERAFVPEDSYLNDYLDAADKFFPSQGIDVYFIFGGSDIYASRQALAELDTRLSGLSEKSPYIAEPVSEEAYRNVMTGFGDNLNPTGSTEEIGSIELGEDNWPTNNADFVKALSLYASITGPGAVYAPNVSFSEDGTQLEAIRVQSEYVRLTKLNGGEIIDDADRQIEAMDRTREMVASWDDLPTAFPYSSKFLTIEGFKIIRRELFMNVGLAIAAVGVIVFCTVGSFVTAFLILLSVAFCIIEILGVMWALGIVIDSVSVINIVLAVGLSVDYSAHVGHCFMTKGGVDKNRRALEALADIGAAVLNGAVSTFLAVAVLLFSSSYVFEVLSRQFALTVALGIAHGLILLPVLLSIFGPKPFESAEKPDEDAESEEELEKSAEDQIAATSHLSAKGENNSDDEELNDEDGNNVMKDAAVVEA